MSEQFEYRIDFLLFVDRNFWNMAMEFSQQLFWSLVLVIFSMNNWKHSYIDRQN